MSRANKRLVCRFLEEVVNQDNLKLLPEVVAPDHVRHAPDGDLYDLEGVRIDLAEWRVGVPDLELVVEDVIAEADRVVSRVVLHGTHAGPLLGVAPTGRAVAVVGITVDRIAGGKLAESWMSLDSLCLLRPWGRRA